MIFTCGLCGNTLSSYICCRMTYGLTHGWIPLDRSRGLERLGFIFLAHFSTIGLDTTPAPGCLHAPLLPSQSISSASGYQAVCSLACPSSLAVSRFLMLTAWQVFRSTLLSQTCFRTALLAMLSPCVCCEKRQTQAAAPTSYTTAGKTKAVAKQNTSKA